MAYNNYWQNLSVLITHSCASAASQSDDYSWLDGQYILQRLELKFYDPSGKIIVNSLYPSNCFIEFEFENVLVLSNRMQRVMITS